jgi:hypothetical protein
MQDNEQPTQFTKTEKKVLLTETTGITIGVLVLIVIGVVYVVTVAGVSSANSKAITLNEQRINSFVETYKGHTRIVDKNFNELKGEIGELKGQNLIIIELLKRNDASN